MKYIGTLLIVIDCNTLVPVGNFVHKVKSDFMTS